jgi:hypothetical protein
MRSTKLALACLAISAAIAAPAFAQEGHPLKGTWLGDWGPSKTDRNPIFIVMDWDGKQISGMINPGTDNIRLINPRVTPPPPRPAGGGRGGGGGGGGNRGGGGGAQGGAQGAAAPGGAAAGAAAPAGQGGGGARGGQGGGAAAGAGQGGGGGRGGQQAAGAGGGAPAAGAGAGQGGGGNRGGQGGGAAAGGGAPAAAAAPQVPPPPQDWIVQFEADAKDRSGNTIRYIVEGKIENVGLYNRSIVGTWSHGNVKGDFRVQRQ